MLLNYALHTQNCVCPHQVNHYVRTFDALFRNCMYGFQGCGVGAEESEGF